MSNVQATENLDRHLWQHKLQVCLKPRSYASGIDIKPIHKWDSINTFRYHHNIIVAIVQHKTMPYCVPHQIMRDDRLTALNAFNLSAITLPCVWTENISRLRMFHIGCCLSPWVELIARSACSWQCTLKLVADLIQHSVLPPVHEAAEHHARRRHAVRDLALLAGGAENVLQTFDRFEHTGSDASATVLSQQPTLTVLGFKLPNWRTLDCCKISAFACRLKTCLVWCP